jgi:phosphinothricin acetyltransferase
VALAALIQAAEEVGLWKLVSRIFVENAASRRLCQVAGFREVGIYASGSSAPRAQGGRRDSR